MKKQLIFKNFEEAKNYIIHNMPDQFPSQYANHLVQKMIEVGEIIIETEKPSKIKFISPRQASIEALQASNNGTLGKYKS